MRYVKLGRAGLDVSPIALGCMSYGEARPGQPGDRPPGAAVNAGGGRPGGVPVARRCGYQGREAA